VPSSSALAPTAAREVKSLRGPRQTGVAAALNLADKGNLFRNRLRVLPRLRMLGRQLRVDVTGNQPAALDLDLAVVDRSRDAPALIRSRFCTARLLSKRPRIPASSIEAEPLDRPVSATPR
jgi:hypothetical protein